MILFHAYKEDRRAPTVRVAKVGGIYRQETGLIKVTLIDGESYPSARVHVLWEPWEWVDCQEMLNFAIKEFKRGTFANDGPRTH
jgi:hypothetical protein